MNYFDPQQIAEGYKTSVETLHAICRDTSLMPHERINAAKALAGIYSTVLSLRLGIDLKSID